MYNVRVPIYKCRLPAVGIGILFHYGQFRTTEMFKTKEIYCVLGFSDLFFFFFWDWEWWVLNTKFFKYLPKKNRWRIVLGIRMANQCQLTCLEITWLLNSGQRYCYHQAGLLLPVETGCFKRQCLVNFQV